MRNTLEQWEKGVLCELWHRAELAILDDRARTPQYTMRMVDRELRKMQLEYRRETLDFGTAVHTNPLPDYTDDVHDFAKKILHRATSKT